MKKLLLAVLFTTSLTTSVIAQDFSFGAKAGLNIASLNWDDRYDMSPKLGINVGGFVNYKLKEKLALQSELFFSQGGGSWENSGFEGEVKISLLSLPVLVQYDIIENLYLEGGIQYNFILSNKESLEGGDFEDFTDNFKTGAFGFAIGAAYRLDSLLPGLVAGIRYTADLSNLNDIVVNAGDYKTRAIQISLLYKLSK